MGKIYTQVQYREGEWDFVLSFKGTFEALMWAIKDMKSHQEIYPHYPIRIVDNKEAVIWPTQSIV